MVDFFKNFFEKENIDFFSALPIEKTIVINPRKMPENIKTAVVFLLPYNTCGKEKRNISRYAVSRDYHMLAAELYKKISSDFEEKFKGEKIFCFSDSSPIAEVDAAVKAHLGIIGKNHLLINKVYGSFCFIESFLLTRSVIFDSGNIDCSKTGCLDCGLCKKNCPQGCLYNNNIKSSCVSMLTQKKTLSEEELLLVKNSPLVWGCDICQEVCPLNKNALPTKIEFFKTQRTPYLTRRLIENMSEEQFAERAYAWRGRNVILRNLKLKENKHDS